MPDVEWRWRSPGPPRVNLCAGDIEATTLREHQCVSIIVETAVWMIRRIFLVQSLGVVQDIIGVESEVSCMGFPTCCITWPTKKCKWKARPRRKIRKAKRVVRPDILVVSHRVVVHHKGMLAGYNVIIVKSQIQTTLQGCPHSNGVMDTIDLPNLHYMGLHLLIPNNVDRSV
jgi:hypothetical protein